MRHTHSDQDNTQIFGIAAIAAGIGAITALLFSSKNGTETRQAIRDKAQQFKTKARQSKEDIAEAADNAADVATKVKNDVKDAIDEAVKKEK